MKQKGFAVVLIACLLIGCLGGCATKKANDPIPQWSDSVTPGDVTPSSVKKGIAFALPSVAAAPGEKIVVPVLVNADSNVAAVDFVVTYDSDAISYESFSAGLSFKAGISDANEVKKGEIKITMATLTPQKSEGRMCELTFRVADDATPGEIPLNLACTTCCNYDSKPLVNQCQNGSITVK